MTHTKPQVIIDLDEYNELLKLKEQLGKELVAIQPLVPGQKITMSVPGSSHPIELQVRQFKAEEKEIKYICERTDTRDQMILTVKAVIVKDSMSVHGL